MLKWIVLVFIVAKFFMIYKSKRILQDAYTYHLMARAMNKCKSSNINADFYLIDKHYKVKLDYPFLFPRVFSFIKEDFREKYFRYLNILLELLNVIFAIIMAFFLSKDIDIAILCGIFFYLTPILFRESFEFTGRIFSNILYNIMIVNFFVFYNNHYLGALILSLTFGLLLLISHKMEIQGLLFLACGFSFIRQDVIPIFSYIILLILGIVVFKNRYADIFFGHINFLVWVKKYLKKKSVKFNIKDFFIRLIKYILCNPLSLFVIYFYMDIPLTNGIYRDFYLAIIIVFIFSYMIIEFEKLHFIGTGERYLEQISFFVAYLAAIVLIDYQLINNILIICFIVGDLYITFRVENSGEKINEKSLLELIEFLKNRNEENCIIFPNVYCNIISYYARKTVVGGLGSKGLIKGSDYFFEEKPVRELFEKYRVELIVAKKNYDLKNDYIMLINETIFNNEEFVVYKVGV